MPSEGFLKKWSDTNEAIIAPIPVKITSSQNGSITDYEKAQRCANGLTEKGIDITDNYNDWWLTLASLASLGEEGRSIAHQVSSLSLKYDQSECNKKFNEALKNSKINDIDYFLKRCKDLGINYFISGSVSSATSDKSRNSSIYEKNPPQAELVESEKTTTSFTELLKYKYNAANLIPKPIGVITIDDSIISTAGNITVIAGASKVGKSGLIGAGLAGAIRQKGDVVEEENLLGLSVAFNEGNKGVIHIDSEQSRYDHQRLNQQILKRCNRVEPPEYYYSFSLQKSTPNELKDNTELIFTEVAKRHNGLHLAIIDGVGDFVSSVNDEVEGNEVINTFIRLATDFNIPVVLVLHFNPGSEKGRGHIGSHLERKCESFLSIEKIKDSETSAIKPKLLRNSGAFDEIIFEYNKEKGFHTLIQKVNKEEEARHKSESIKAKKLVEYQSIVEAVFEDQEKVRRKDIVTALMDYYNIQKRGAEKRADDLTGMGLVEKQGLFYIKIRDALVYEK